MKKFLSLLTALALVIALGMPALADPLTEVAVQPETAPTWAQDGLIEAGSLGLWGGEYGADMGQPISGDALAALTDAVADKLTLLGLETRDATLQPVLNATRGAVVQALFAEAAQYSFPALGEGTDAVEFFTTNGILRGDENGNLHLDRPCTLLEAVTMAQRLVLAVYDLNDAGTRGLLWKATHEGNTLYLFGTAHLDRNNLYPFHSTVRDALMGAEAAYFEIDLNDESGIEEITLMQMYTDGTTLKDHVSAEVYEKSMAVLVPPGLDEETAAAVEAELSIYKPWALAVTLQNLMLMDDTTNATVLATDAYLTNKAYAAGIPVSGVETYALQIAVFDTLSAEYQQDMLESMLDIILGLADGDIDDVGDAVDTYFLPWQRGDLEGFEAGYGKAEIVSGEDELSARLFTNRDPGMIDAAVELLQTEGEHVFFYAVGAGHMVDPGGIISALRELGYTVERVL